VLNLVFYIIKKWVVSPGFLLSVGEGFSPHQSPMLSTPLLGLVYCAGYGVYVTITIIFMTNSYSAAWLGVLCRVWSVRYNHFHDQLVLTSSSDSRVILNNLASISSEPYGHLLDDEADEDDDEDRDKKLDYTAVNDNKWPK